MVFGKKRSLLCAALLLASQSLLAQECVDSYAVSGCGEVAVDIDNGLQITQNRALVAKDGDDDQDGVLNKQDQCPGTPKGLVVNADGCPLLEELVVHFDSDEFALPQSDLSDVQAFAEYLRANPYFEVKIVGHTDSVHSEEYNQSLSMRRAQSLKEGLISHGVEYARITIDGKGESVPLFENKTLKGRFGNRRAEVVLFHAGQPVNPSIFEAK